jgi:hypothetical protein
MRRLKGYCDQYKHRNASQHEIRDAPTQPRKSSSDSGGENGRRQRPLQNRSHSQTEESARDCP